MWKYLILFGALFVLNSASRQNERILLTDVQVLTLYGNQKTTGRRSSPIPQVKCLGGTASKSNYHPDTVQCYNRGTDGVDVQWECKADLDKTVKFGKINVYCEGYDYPDDPYILKGSCGLEYHLDYVTGAGGHTQDQKSWFTKSEVGHEGESGGIGTFVVFVVVCVVIYLIYSKCLATDHHGDRHPTGQQPRFPGGGPPPPPPYDAPPPPYPGHGPSAPPPGGDAPPGYGFKQQSAGAAGGFQQEQHYRQERQAPTGAAAGAGAGAGAGMPGFWTGMGTGGVLGYLFGRNTGGGRTHGGGSWFGGGATRQQQTYGDDRDFGFFRRSEPSTSSSTRYTSSSGTSGSGTHTSSGFGGTRRR